MNRCQQSRRAQDWLEGELSPDQARAFQEHLQTCTRCAAEVRLFRRLFDALEGEALRVPDPGPALTERILDRVVPSRLRARWVSAVGWGYGAASAVSTFAFISWIVQPSTPLWLTQFYGEASVRVAQTLGFSFQTLTRSALQIFDIWAMIQIVAGRAIPIGRALTRPLWDPTVASITVAAVLSCAALLWWMRPRRRAQEVGDVGLLF